MCKELCDDDPEVVAVLDKINELLKTLNDEQRVRVISWVVDKYRPRRAAASEAGAC